MDGCAGTVPWPPAVGVAEEDGGRIPPDNCRRSEDGREQSLQLESAGYLPEPARDLGGQAGQEGKKKKDSP